MTIRLRLTIYWALVLTSLLLIAGVLVFVLFQRQQWGRLDSALMEEADTVAQTIARNGTASAAPLVLRLSRERDLGPRRRVWLVSGGRQIAEAGANQADLPLIDGARGRPSILDGREHIFRYAVVPLDDGGYLADGVDASAVRASVARLRTSLLLVLPLLLIFSVSVGYWLAGRALAPLVVVAGGLAAIKPRDLSRRLPSAPPRDEVNALVQAINSMLERVERAVVAQRRFVADAAHELRTPLSVLRSGLEIALQRPRSPADYAAALDSALRDVAALCATADDLLALTRLDQEIELERRPFDLTELAREVLEAIEPLAEARQVAIAVGFGESLVVEANQNYLRRVLINLLDNALKYSPTGGQIDITLEARSGMVVLRIADRGPGVAPHELSLIFNRFFRGKGHHAPGNGLGLSLCREIIELHGGAISVANRAGGGAEFVISLPRHNLNVC